MTMNLMEVSIFIVVFILLFSVLLGSAVKMGMSGVGDFAFVFFIDGVISVLAALGSSTLVHYVGLSKGLLYLAIAILVILVLILVGNIIKISFDMKMSMTIGLLASILFVFACVVGIVFFMSTNANFFS